MRGDGRPCNVLITFSARRREHQSGGMMIISLVQRAADTRYFRASTLVKGFDQRVTLLTDEGCHPRGTAVAA